MASNDNLEEGEPMNLLEVPLREDDQQQDPDNRRENPPDREQQDPDFRRVNPANRDHQQPDPGFRRVHPANRDLYLADRDHQQDPDFRRIHPADRDLYPADLAARGQQQQDPELHRVHLGDGDPQARRRGPGNAEAQGQPQELPRVGQFSQKAVLDFIYGVFLCIMIIILLLLLFHTIFGN